MGNTLLVIVGLFMIAMIVIGMKKGLVKMLLSFASFFVVIVLVNLLNPVVTDLLKDTPVRDSVYSRVSDYVEENISNKASAITDTGVGAQEDLIDNLSLPNSVKDKLKSNNQKSTYAELGVDNFASYISESLTNMILSAGSYILLFIVITILIRVLIKVLDVITKLPVIHEFNAAGGALVGLLESLIIIWILCIIVTAFSTTGLGQDICKGISENEILSFLYDNNLIKNAITGMFGSL